MLFSYMRRTQRILRDQRVQLISPDDLKAYINEARRQVAGESECVLALSTINIASASQTFRLSDIGFSGGIGGALNVRTVWLIIGGAKRWITPRPWPWFSLYNLTIPAASTGPPTVWSQLSPGSNGALYVAPVPDQVYVLSLDCSCYPADLAIDTDVEVIPLLWTDAIAYYAAYLGLMAMQTGGNTRESDGMYKRYQEYVARARLAANPAILPSNYAQSQPMPSNQLAGSPPQGGQ